MCLYFMAAPQHQMEVFNTTEGKSKTSQYRLLTVDLYHWSMKRTGACITKQVQLVLPSLTQTWVILDNQYQKAGYQITRRPKTALC